MNRLQLFMYVIFFLYHSLWAQETHDKWIVVTTINYPTKVMQNIKALHQFIEQNDWHLVVVADKKTPQDWDLPHCDYLSVEKQQELGYRICNLLPWNHYARKNIGYLYAIEHGAKIIYDTDDDNILMSKEIPFYPENTNMLAYQTDETVINPYIYFGHPSIWPRGYPLEKIQAPALYTFEHKQVRPLVQQYLVDGDPDVDGIYRLTRGIPYVSFLQKPAVCVPEGTFCPYNSQGTMYHFDAFWGLVIPITTTFRVCDIWRGYWVQRLLWDINGGISFLPPAIVQERNAHNYFKDFIDELDLYTKSGELVNFLKNWQSNERDLVHRIMALTQDMISQEYYKEAEAIFMQAWLDDLKDIGYQFPALLK